MRRLCEHCGAEIPDTRRADAVFCSRTCSKAAYGAFVSAEIAKAKAGRCCEWCSGPMPAGFTSRRQFCTVTCQRQARRAKQKAARPLQTCPACGTEFRATIPGQTWCSRACSTPINNRRRARTRSQTTD